MVTVIEGDGTAEEVWSAWDGPRGWPAVPAASFARPLVVAPHPDDEILGIGGLLSMIGGGDIVAVTDGEASHPHLSADARHWIALRRPAETRMALTALGGTYTVTRLSQPDGSIDEPALGRALRPVLAPGRVCLATWRGDGHPDHEAVGRAAAAACAASGAVLVEYPIWMWHWAAPGDPRVPWTRARRVALTSSAATAKSSAIRAFVTQISEIGGVTVLPPPVVARFRRPYEVVFA